MTGFPLLLLLFASLAGAAPFEFALSEPVSGSPGNHLATLTMRVAAGHLLYKERLGLTLSNGTVAAVFPPAHEKPDPFENKLVQVFDSGEYPVSLQLSPTPGQTGPATLTFGYQGCSSQTCFMPEEARLAVTFAPAGQPGAPLPAPASSPALADRPVETGSVSTPTGKMDLARNIREHGLFWTLVIAFLGGVLVSFTPCVYPMIPITLSIIGGRRENTSVRRGFALSVSYVAGLSLTYALLGLLVASFGAQIRGTLQGPLFQTLIAAIFFLLALSMFDVFMLQVPSFLRQRLSDVKGTGITGVFFMGMVSGLMASPCIAAPLAGILAFIAASGDPLTGFLLLTAFAWGMGILLIVIGTFSGSLNSLPRAGEWMDRVKEFYGFLLLGAALYFVQPLLGTAVINLLTALLLGAVAAFLGLFDPLAEATGLWPKILKAWSLLVIVVAAAFGVTAAVEWGGLHLPPPPPGLRAPAGIAEAPAWFSDLDPALRKAIAERKPVFIDFRADWCTICRELEETVFVHPDIAALFRKMVLVKIDATTSSPAIDALVTQWKVMGLPTLIILNPDGRERDDLRIVGDVGVAELKKVLEKAFPAE